MTTYKIKSAIFKVIHESAISDIIYSISLYFCDNIPAKSLKKFKVYSNLNFTKSSDGQIY